MKYIKKNVLAAFQHAFQLRSDMPKTADLPFKINSFVKFVNSDSISLKKTLWWEQRKLLHVSIPSYIMLRMVCKAQESLRTTSQWTRTRFPANKLKMDQTSLLDVPCYKYSLFQCKQLVRFYYNSFMAYIKRWYTC